MSRLRHLLDTVRGRNQRRGNKDTNASGLSDTNTLPPPPPLPLLPAERRPITPPATLTPAAAELHVAVLGSLARLPPELRRRVLVAAFGDRTLHLDLRLAPRGQRPSNSAFSEAEYEHGRGWAPISWSRVVMNGDTPVPVKEMVWEWRWYGCVCHRLIPYDSPMERDFTARGVSPYMWPYQDDCLRGKATMCQLWPTGPLTTRLKDQQIATCDAAVGAMGWLRACRQAYFEGIEVLYATNTFFIESQDLLDALIDRPNSDPLTPSPGRRLLLSQRLADIRSLELRLDFLLCGDFTLPPLTRGDDKNKTRQLPHLGGLMVPFPNLRSLVITFSDCLYNDWGTRLVARLPEIDRSLLQPLALAVASFPPQHEKPVVVELPSNVFRDLKGLGLIKEQRGDEWGNGKGIWLRYPIGDSSFYYIKQGVESDVEWGHDGNPRSVSGAIACPRHTPAI